MIAVAQTHVTNGETNDAWYAWSNPSGACDLHSWVDDIDGNRFDACCNARDGSSGSCIHSKTREITVDFPNHGCQQVTSSFADENAAFNWPGKISSDRAVNTNWANSYFHKEAMEATDVNYIGCAMGEHLAQKQRKVVAF